MTKGKIEVTKKSMLYNIGYREGKDFYQTDVEIDDVGRITIKKGKDFTFVRSQRKCVRAIAKLLDKASELPGVES